MQPQPQTNLCVKRAKTEPRLPSVISESLVNQFKYWDQTIRQGMYYNNELYTYFQKYTLAERLKAYTIAGEQTEQGLGVCITVSKTHYSIWLNLRSLSSLTLSDDLASEPNEKVLATAKRGEI